MTDVQSTTKVKRETVSRRDYIDLDGNVVKKMEEAAGARYTLVGTDSVFEAYFAGPKVNEAQRTMCAIMGFHTKVGNVANTVLNDKNDPGDKDDAAVAIEDFLAGTTAETPVWAEKTEGGGGLKVDRDALTQAILRIMGPALEAKGKPALDPVVIRQRLDDDKLFFRSMRQVPEIRSAYEEIVGKGSGKTVADVADLFA